jgi:hypothetical protein
MIPNETDPLLDFVEVGRRIRPERPVHVSTIHRWRKGVRGHRLETTLVGGRRYVRLSQLEAFIAALSGLGEPSPQQPAREREHQIGEAERELNRAGIR